MLATFMRLIVLCFAVILAACSETVSNNEADDDLNLRFAPLNDGQPIEKAIQGPYWVTRFLPSDERPGFFIFNDLLRMRHSSPIERIIIHFGARGRWNSWLIVREWQSRWEPRVEQFVIGDYLFTDDGQFMMSGGQFGCLDSVVGRYYLKGDTLALRANRFTLHFTRYDGDPLDLLAEVAAEWPR